MNKNKLTDLENILNISTMLLKAVEEVKQANAEREKRNKAKALDEAYVEYCRNNPPTDSECRKAAEEIQSCMKEKEEKLCLK